MTISSELARLRATPVIAWPTLCILVGAFALIALSWTLVILELWPMWLGMLVNTLAGYALFTPAHEAIHRCAARNARLNDVVLASATFLALPFGKGKLFRLMHMRHHRFTNEERDPDLWMASSLKHMPLWGLWPFVYLVNFLRDPQQVPGVSTREVWRELVVAGLVFAGLLLWQPYYMAMLWLIPTYLAFFLMCLVFMVLPHYPHNARQDTDPNTTALMRMGQEWWQTPVLMYQNYHLVHHLYPTVPFYRYGRAWRARIEHHMAHCGSVIVGPFDLGRRC